MKFGNLPGYGASVEGKYQGQSYDWLFLDEATNFTEEEFRGLAACVRGVNRIPKRVYLTCNPGGVGHAWVKRLFLDRRFRPGEEPADYCFIPATVDDNRDLMVANPDYVKQLELCRRTNGGRTGMGIGTPWRGPTSASLTGTSMSVCPFSCRLAGPGTGRLTMGWICWPVYGWRWSQGTMLCVPGVV